MSIPLAKDGKGEPDSDRDTHGRFLPGHNLGGPGNPHARAVAAWREALFNAITPADVEAVILILKAKACAGESWAVREFLDRVFGKASQTVDLTSSQGLLKTYLCVDVEKVVGKPRGTANGNADQ